MVSAVKESGRDKVFLLCNYIYVFLAFIVVAYPVIYMISASISDPKLVGSGEMWLWPKGITFEGYQRVFQNSSIWSGYGNTILYTVVGTSINLFVTLPAAYALSRKDFMGRNFFMGMFLVTMFLGRARTKLLAHQGTRYGEYDLGNRNSFGCFNLEHHCSAHVFPVLYTKRTARGCPN